MHELVFKRHTWELTNALVIPVIMLAINDSNAEADDNYGHAVYTKSCDSLFIMRLHGWAWHNEEGWIWKILFIYVCTYLFI